MNNKDKQAFDAALVDRCCKHVTTPQDFEAGWQAAIKHRDKQAKPVGQVTSGMQQNGSQCFKPYSDDALPIGAEIYATAQPMQPAAAINEQLLEALNWAEARLEELGEHELVGRCAAAIAAAEAALKSTKEHGL